jgi:hypothetical protein
MPSGHSGRGESGPGDGSRSVRVAYFRALRPSLDKIRVCASLLRLLLFGRVGEDRTLPLILPQMAKVQVMLAAIGRVTL